MITLLTRYSHVQYSGSALLEDQVAQSEQKARAFFDHNTALQNEHGGPDSLWIFGQNPTVLDAHCVPFIMRLLDNKREDLVPQQLQDYAARVAALPQWNTVTGGKSTLWSRSVGHVKDLEPYW